MRRFLNWLFLGGLVLFVGVPVLLMTVGAMNKTRHSNIAAGDPKATEPASGAWNYSIDKDDLTDKAHHSACLTSTNRIYFAFPYQGGSTADLCFQRFNGHLESYFQVNRGHIQCYAVDGCTVRLRFDDHPVSSRHGTQSTTHESNLVFLSDANGLLKQVGSTTKLRIEAEYYQQGRQTFEFATAGLDSKRID